MAPHRNVVFAEFVAETPRVFQWYLYWNYMEI
jgi:hypothetical protein